MSTVQGQRGRDCQAGKLAGSLAGQRTSSAHNRARVGGDMRMLISLTRVQRLTQRQEWQKPTQAPANLGASAHTGRGAQSARTNRHPDSCRDGSRSRQPPRPRRDPVDSLQRRAHRHPPEEEGAGSPDLVHGSHAYVPRRVDGHGGSRGSRPAAPRRTSGGPPQTLQRRRTVLQAGADERFDEVRTVHGSTMSVDQDREGPQSREESLS